MPLVKLDPAPGVADDIWRFVEDDAELPADGCVVVSAARFSADSDALLTRNMQIGVRLSPADDPSDLAEHMDRIALVEISFPKYTDGRGYSQAQLLRRRYGYDGELRAVGEVLRDQLLFMARSGFDAFQFDPTSGEAAATIEAALSEFTDAYQPAADTRRPVYAQRAAARTPVNA
ncbi:MAG: DUF934 domain-containing protein [Pseudomonadota bacterium]